MEETFSLAHNLEWQSIMRRSSPTTTNQNACFFIKFVSCLSRGFHSTPSVAAGPGLGPLGWWAVILKSQHGCCKAEIFSEAQGPATALFALPFQADHISSLPTLIHHAEIWYLLPDGRGHLSRSSNSTDSYRKGFIPHTVTYTLTFVEFNKSVMKWNRYEWRSLYKVTYANPWNKMPYIFFHLWVPYFI